MVFLTGSSVLVFSFSLFIFNLGISNADVIDDLKIEITQKEKEIEELKEKAAEYQEVIRGEQKKKRSLQNQLVIYNAKINKLEADLELTVMQLSETSLKIKKIEIEIQGQEETLIEEKQFLAEIIRTLNELDEESLIEIILKDQSFSELFNQIEYTELLQGDIQRRVEAIKILGEQLENEKIEKEDKKADLEDLEDQLGDQKIMLSGERTQRANLLEETKEAEWRYQKLLEEIREKETEIQKEIFELESKLRYAIDPSSIPGFEKGVLSWPSDGVLTQKYGPTSETGFINNVYTFHNGIDLSAGFGTSIKVAASGKIIGMGDCGKYTYGKWIAVEHGNGLTTLYAHLSLTKASTGDMVERGNVIGYEGSTGFSTGSHLHFGVYASNTFRIEQRPYGLLPIGGHIDPMNYL